MVALVTVCSLALMAAAPPAGEAALPAASIEKLSKRIQEYFAYLDESDHANARKEMSKLIEELEDASKAAKVEDPLRLVGDLREVFRRGSILKKPAIKLTPTSGFGLKAVELEAPLPKPGTSNDVKRASSGKLRVWVSLPKAPKAKEPPVLLALHPLAEVEVRGVKDLMSAGDVDKWVKEWAQATYAPELLAEVIVVVPVMDHVILTPSGMEGSRPDWSSPEGTVWAYTALRDIVFYNANHDPSRIFIDGHGSGAQAGLVYCSRFPALQTGAIVWGQPPDEIQFRNCLGSRLLFVGTEEPLKEFCGRWSQEKGFHVDRVDLLGADGVLSWMQGAAKTFCPERVEIVTPSLAYATSYWLRISELDRTLEGTEPARVVGEVNRQANEITLTTNKKVKQVILYLNDELLDLDKEIRVLHRVLDPEKPDAEPEVKFAGRKKRDLSAAVELAYSRVHSNTGEVYVAQVEVDL